MVDDAGGGVAGFVSAGGVTGGALGVVWGAGFVPGAVAPAGGGLSGMCPGGIVIPGLTGLAPG